MHQNHQKAASFEWAENETGKETSEDERQRVVTWLERKMLVKSDGNGGGRRKRKKIAKR